MGRGPASKARVVRGIRWVGASGAAFVVAAVAAQAVPLLDVLGFEYALVVCALVSVVGTLRIAERASAQGGACGAAWWSCWARWTLDLCGLVLIAGAISLLNGLRVTNCEPLAGLAYLTVFGIGATPLAAATGLVLAHAERRYMRISLVGLLTLASLISTAATLALEPAIVAYDSYFGYFAGSIYDESLVGLRGHLAYRAWSVATAVLAVALVSARWTRTRRDWTIAAVAAGTLLGMFTFRGEIGLDRTRAYVERALGGFVQTEHFDIHYDARSFDRRRAQLLAYDHEARFAELAAFWQVEPPERLRSWVYGSRDQKGELMGGRNTLVAKIWLGEMHITWSGLGDDMLAHEMAHLFLKEDGTGPLDLSTRAGLVPNMALVEGAATAAAWGGDELDPHGWSAALLELGLADSVAALLGPVGFWTSHSRTAYTLTGSFVRWLIERHGPERFRAAYGHGDFEGVYGSSLEELEREWHGFLGQQPLTPAQLDAARFRYDRPSLFGRRCARSIATRLQRGSELMRSGDDAEATRCFESIVRDDPTAIPNRLRIARAYLSMDKPQDAERHALALLEMEGLGRSASMQASELVADIAWVHGDLNAAFDRYRALTDEAGLEHDRVRLHAKASALAMRDTAPRSADAIRDAFGLGQRHDPVTISTMLVHAGLTEGAALPLYLAIRRLPPGDGLRAAEALAEDIDTGDLGEAQRLRLLESLAIQRAWAGDAAAACAAWSAVGQGASPRSARLAKASMWGWRCANGQLPPPQFDERSLTSPQRLE